MKSSLYIFLYVIFAQVRKWIRAYGTSTRFTIKKHFKCSQGNNRYFLVTPHTVAHVSPVSSFFFLVLSSTKRNSVSLWIVFFSLVASNCTDFYKLHSSHRFFGTILIVWLLLDIFHVPWRTPATLQAQTGCSHHPMRYRKFAKIHQWRIFIFVCCYTFAMLWK